MHPLSATLGHAVLTCELNLLNCGFFLSDQIYDAVLIMLNYLKWNVVPHFGDNGWIPYLFSSKHMLSKLWMLNVWFYLPFYSTGPMGDPGSNGYPGMYLWLVIKLETVDFIKYEYRKLKFVNYSTHICLLLSGEE